jgi:hypothetical protein
MILLRALRGDNGEPMAEQIRNNNESLRAAPSWLFFRVARSSRIGSDMLVVTASPARTVLKNSQLTGGERHAISGKGHKQLHESIKIIL